VKRTFLAIAAFLNYQVLFAQSADTAFKPYQQNIPGTTINFKMVPIPGGKFTLGSPAADKQAKPDEQPQRTVSISPFWMGAYEVTHDEFDMFFNDQQFAENSKVDAVTRPTPQYIDLSWGMGKEGGYPANSMQQFTALMYCRWLYQKTGIFYRLPTEAEWEYAARAGATTVYPFGNDPKDLDKYAWYKGNSNKAYQKVGQKAPNAWGLYDMLGNVAEWTLDQYDEQGYTKIADGATDPFVAPTSRHPKTVRGGSFEDEAEALRPAARRSWQADWNKRDPQIPKSRWWLTDAYFVGFRIVRPVKQPTPEEADAFYKTHLGQ
jgi:formylglycine-generating enzyme required for sulfatase activity